MPLLKILIADDEKEARELILHYLHDWKGQVEVKETADGNATLQALQQFDPDILFLDIKMPGRNGIEVLQQREISPLPAIIFTTAFDEFALPAFDFEAVDYLVKPFEKERFDKAFRRAVDYTAFIRNKRNVKYLVQLPVKTGSKTSLISITDIMYFQSVGSYVQVITSLNTYLISKPIYELETELDPKNFLRIHRSIIVNINSIQAMKSLLNGDHLVILKNDQELKASRTYKENLKLIMFRYQ